MVMKIDTINSPKENSFIYGTWDDSPMYIKDSCGKSSKMGFLWWKYKRCNKEARLYKSLGANIIYLSPIFKSSSCHKYDTGDYENVDEMFGTNEEFKELCKKAERKE